MVCLQKPWCWREISASSLQSRVPWGQVEEVMHRERGTSGMEGAAGQGPPASRISHQGQAEVPTKARRAEALGDYRGDTDGRVPDPRVPTNCRVAATYATYALQRSNHRARTPTDAVLSVVPLACML